MHPPHLASADAAHAPEADTTSHLYNEYAEDRTVHPRAQGLVKHWHRAMASQFERRHGKLAGRDVLEVGHGHGMFGEIVRERGGRYHALEMNAALADAGIRKGMSIEVGRIPPLPPSLAGRFDVAWTCNVLEHARDWIEAHAMVESLFAALRPGGVLTIIVPDYMSWGIELWNSDWSHGFPTTARRCVQLMRDVGLKDVRCDSNRGARFDLPGRAVAATIAKLAPFRLFDRLTSRSEIPDTGFGYSYMTLFGWRQLFLTGRRP